MLTHVMRINIGNELMNFKALNFSYFHENNFLTCELKEKHLESCNIADTNINTCNDNL